MRPKPSEDSIRRIIVEGEIDRQTVLRLLLDRGYGFSTDEILVEHTNGRDNLVTTIRDRLMRRQFYSNQNNAVVGIIIDADDDLDNIWKRINTELIRAEVHIHPSRAPDPKGSIFVRPKPRLKVGVWVMPDNVNTGELEDFVARMVPEDNADWRLAREYVHSTERKFGKKVTRAEVWAWIATRKEPSRFDEAIKNGDLHTDGEPCQRFIAWLNRLFTTEEGAANIA